MFLRACATLEASGRQSFAVIVGEGAEGTEMQALATNLGLGNRVRFAGLRTNIADIISIAHVTVITSDIEGFPNILLEAQLAGCPVVATRAGGTSEVVEHGITGFLVRSSGLAAVATDLARFIDDPANLPPRLDALAYRLLTLCYAKRRHKAEPNAIHFFVGSLGLGGAQRNLLTLVRFLVARGYRCKVWVQDPRGFFDAEIESAGGTRQSIFDSPAAPWRGQLLLQVWRILRYRSHVWMAFALWAHLRREHPAVLQCLLDTTNVAGALAGRMAGVPVVVAGLQSLHPAERSDAVATRFQQRCYRLLRPDLVDAVVANSESRAGQLSPPAAGDAGIESSRRAERPGPYAAILNNGHRDPP